MVWSDETKINCLGSDGCKWVWKRLGEGLSDRLVEGTVKFGEGSVMIWGCMTWKGVGYAAKIDGGMDSDLYLQILKDDLLNTLEYHGLNPSDMLHPWAYLVGMRLCCTYILPYMTRVN